MLNKKNINFSDIIMAMLIVVLLAYKDYTQINIVIQIVAFITIATKFLIENRFKIERVKMEYVLFKSVFIIFCLISLIWCIEFNSSFSTCITLVLRMMTGVTIIMYIRTEREINKFLYLIILGALALCVRIIYTVPFSMWGKVRIGNYLAHTLTNSYGNTGITYVLGFAITFMLSNSSVIKNKKIKYALIFIFTFFSLLSGSKKQIILLIVAIYLLIYLKSKSPVKFIKNTLIFVVLGGCILYFVLNNAMLYNVVGKRVNSFMNFFSDDASMSVNVDASTIGRNNLLTDAWKIFTQKPVLGIGIANFNSTNKEHVWAENNFVELLADVGIIGFTLYYIMIAKMTVFNLKSIKSRKNIDIQLFVALACFLVVDFTMVSYFNTTLQLYQAYMYAIYAISKRNKNVEVIE